MKTLLAVIALASVATFSAGAMAADDEEQIFNIQSISGLVQITGCCGQTPGQDWALHRFAIVPLTAPGKNSRVTITDEGIPDELTLKGVNISVTTGSDVVEKGAIKFGVTETGQFVAPASPDQIASQSFANSNFGRWKTTTAASPLRFAFDSDSPVSATSYGAYAAGDPTTHIPKSGSATYTAAPMMLPPLAPGIASGTFTGAEGWIVGDFFPVLSIGGLDGDSIIINVDFAGSVTARFTLSLVATFNDGDATITSPIVLSGSGVLNKNGSYTLALTGPLPELSEKWVGTATGMLYGPSAHETAGTLSVVAGAGFSEFHVQASFGGTR
jgi:hypothetical protein